MTSDSARDDSLGSAGSVVSSAGEHAFDAIFDGLLDDDVEQLYHQAPCGYLSTTPEGLITRVNETFLALSGYLREELVGRLSFVDLLSAGGRIYHETHYAPMLRMHGTAREIALDLVRADGTRTPVLVNSVLEHDASGTPLYVRTAVFDARERREYERELLRAKQRAEASEARAVALARTLQQTLIPPTPPQVPHLDVAGAYRPAGTGVEVGGDFYDIFQVGPDDWVVVLGDVCGKGVEAAVVTALARYTLRAAAVEHAQPARALAMLNEVLLRHETDRFATVVFVRLTRRQGEWQAVVSCGGHPLPLVRRAAATRPEAVQSVGRTGTLLGLVPEPVLHDAPLRLGPGDLLVLYTDGVPDGRQGSEFYGDERLQQVVGRQWDSAEDLTSAVLEDALQFQQGMARDDIAVVAVRVPDQL